MSGVPEGFHFRTPWHSTEQPLHEELYRELSEQHQLFGIDARAVARRQDNDDVLFKLFGDSSTAGFAVVHLTWSSHPDQHHKFPRTILYPTFSDWVTHCMNPNADEWEFSEST